jgi:predicted nuclease of predicted toxin-antitoxin system
MRFLIDAQLPPALARALSEAGHDAEHVLDIDLHNADDSAIWDYAASQAAIILSKDEDFPHRQNQNPQKAPTIIWLRMGNTSRRVLLERIQSVLPEIEELIRGGEKLIELR